MASSNILYDKDNLLITDKGIEFKWYYFPLGNSKFVPWSDVKGVEQIRCGLANSSTSPFSLTHLPLSASWRGVPSRLRLLEREAHVSCEFPWTMRCAIRTPA